MLATACLALAELDRHTGEFEVAPELTDDVFVLGRLQDVIVLEPRAVRRETAVALVVGLVVGVLEQVELDLACHHREKSECGGGLHLAAEHSAWSDADQLTRRHVVEVAHDHRGLGYPGNDPDRVPIGGREHVAVALVVARELVARHRVVVHIAGNEVIAVLGACIGDVVEKEPPGRSLADQATLQIGERHQDGVDLAGPDLGFEIIPRDVYSL